MKSQLIVTDLHPVLSEITKFGTFEDNKNLHCAWGRFGIAKDPELNDREIWNYCLRTSYEIEKTQIKDFLSNFIEKRFARHIEKGICCINGCGGDRTILINMTSLFQDETRKLKRVYNCLYCSDHFKENRKLF